MAFWNIDLTTRAGARSALHQASIGCFIFCGMAVLGMAVATFSGQVPGSGTAIIVAAGFELGVALIAAFRLRAGKGLYWTMAAAALLALEIINNIIMLKIGGGSILSVISLVFMINGIRAGFALKRGVGFDDDDYEVFS